VKVRNTFVPWNAFRVASLTGAVAQLAYAQPRVAPGTIDGVVTDTTLAPLADATASILGSGIKVVTGMNGRFRILSLPAGQYILVVRHIGHAPVSTALQVAGGDTLHMSFALERAVTALDTVVVATKRYSMRMAEFEERRRIGFGGEFMTQAEIDKRNSVFVADLLRTFKSVNVIDTGLAAHAYNRRFPVGTRQCEFQVWVDDVPLPPPVDLMRDLPSPKALAGIELYAGAATIPLQYKNTSGSFCGTILVWTKDGT
jgi:hypothetical protein